MLGVSWPRFLAGPPFRLPLLHSPCSGNDERTHRHCTPRSSTLSTLADQQRRANISWAEVIKGVKRFRCKTKKRRQRRRRGEEIISLEDQHEVLAGAASDSSFYPCRWVLSLPDFSTNSLAVQCQDITRRGTVYRISCMARRVRVLRAFPII